VVVVLDESVVVVLEASVVVVLEESVVSVTGISSAATTAGPPVSMPANARDSEDRGAKASRQKNNPPRKIKHRGRTHETFDLGGRPPKGC
jgi:hypothetical protein